MSILRPLAPALLTLALGAAEATPGSAPTAALWKPVANALATGAPEAETQLKDLTRRFPAWADGHRELALWLQRSGKSEAALAEIRAARAIDPSDPELIALEIRLLGAVGKADEAYTLVSRSAGRDTKGILRLEAGLLAAAQGDAGKATTFLAEAKLRCGPRIPSEALMLEARIAILGKDLAKAEVALSSAVGQREDFLEGWRELGRIRLARAEASPEEALSFLGAADQAFSRAAAVDVREVAARIGLGQARLGMAEYLARANDAERAQTTLQSATTPLEDAVALEPENTLGHALLGRTQLRLGHHESALVHLRRAQELGLAERGLLVDLATALAKTGHPADADAMFAAIQLPTAAERLQAGLEAYDNHHDTQAVRWLSAAAPELPGAALQASTWRYAGHAAARFATQAVERDGWLDQAAKCYLAGAILGDSSALDHYIALQAQRSPSHALDAGWATLQVEGLASGRGWSLVLSNLGGDGIGGAVRQAPLTVLSLVLLGLAPLGLGLWLLRRRPQAYASGLARPAVRSSRTTNTDLGLAAAPLPGLRTNSQEPPLTAAPPRLTPGVKPRRSVTTPLVAPPTQSAETMMPAPFANPEGEDDALERR